MIGWEAKIRAKLMSSLPGHKAHSKIMAHRKPLDQLGGIPKDAKQSAVLLLVYPRKRQDHIVFILRSTYEGVHSAQVGLPGGKVEEQDKDLLATALREANEELAIDEDKIEVLGQLSSLYVPPSNFVIHPFIAVQKTEPTFVPDEHEVAEIIEYPISELVKEEALIDTIVKVPGGKMKTKGFMLEDRILWGATAMIIQEFVDLIAE